MKMLDQDLINITKLFKQLYQRQDAAEKILNHFWPNHEVIWINSASTYRNIYSLLSTKTKDVIILQTEEDCFKFFNIHNLRTVIAKSPNWTADSFLITNSEEDYKISKDYITTYHKPGILDLLCYMPYEPMPLNFDSVKYHSSFLYSRKDSSRDIVFDFLKNYKAKLSVCVYDHSKIFSNIDDTCLISKEENIDAPFVSIDKDITWSNSSAFHTVIETFNQYNINPITAKFAPTLSEKTYKAMHLMRPALIFGGYGTRQKLNQLGFDTWDWLINWDYDSEPDPKKSFVMYMKELKRLLSTDIKDIIRLLDQHNQSLINNQNRIFELINNYDKNSTVSF